MVAILSWFRIMLHNLFVASGIYTYCLRVLHGFLNDIKHRENVRYYYTLCITVYYTDALNLNSVCVQCHRATKHWHQKVWQPLIKCDTLVVWRCSDIGSVATCDSVRMVTDDNVATPKLPSFNKMIH